MTQYANIIERDAWLSSEFGEDFARRIFGDEVVDGLPRYVRGKRKGAIKGIIRWDKVERGGWVREYGVENRVGRVIRATLLMPVWGGDDEIISVWELPPRYELD